MLFCALRARINQPYWRRRVNTSQDDVVELVTVINVQFESNTLRLQLSDGRQVSLPLDTIHWLSWLVSATPEQREDWSIEPGGYAVYWDELDDGIEVAHVLGLQRLA